ncbi:MAG: EF-hand domain-containing protein, partial [Phycisphaerales bacterium]
DPLLCVDDTPESTAAAFTAFPVSAGVTYLVSAGAYDANLGAASDLALSFTFTPGPGGGCGLDFNNDGVIEPGDLDDFITAFFSDDPTERDRCDFNNDGVVEPGDLDDYITAYFGGC